MTLSRKTHVLAAICVALVAGCAGDPGSIVCDTGILCPVGMQCAKIQPVCLVNDCGNGVLDQGEVCDDGNIIDGDGCSSNCQSAEKCGNGIIDVMAGEICDDGNATGGDGCSANCKSNEKCGNGIKDEGEACDDGNTTDADGCSANCKSTEVCGNGIVDAEVNEVCDDGNTISGDGCNADCRSGEGCGNGILDPGEECDDGNQNDNDDCLKTCKRNVCGDGIINTGGTHRETCDAGTTGTPVETDTCNIDCTIASCGDGKVNSHAGEECDDGFGNNKDANNCVSTCKLNVCGDGKVDMQPPRIEQCDDGNTDNADGCNNACQLASCGNGQLDPGEQCDDGNNITTDACVSCHNAICGDGFVEQGIEQCDDGNTMSGDGCSPQCKIEGCGNGFLDPGEQCDDGNQVQTDNCVNNCRIASCGDGFVRAGIEQCDDGNTTNGDGCSAGCQLEGCGNGTLDPGEQCDDGNKASGDGCSATCQFEACGDGVVNNGEQCDTGGESATCNSDCTLAKCGDSKVNAHAGEECDQGANDSDHKDCTAGCKINVCGDGKVDDQGSIAKREQCDDGNTVNNDGCSNSCMSAACGNGVIDPGEECDDMNSDTTDGCVNCKFAKCGDGFVEVGVEDCDTNPLNGKPCSAACRLEFCGNGILDLETSPPEECDDGNPSDDGNGCSGACKHIFCGDGLRNNHEACDPTAGDAHCNFDCTASTCGDGQVGNDEDCDASAPGGDAVNCINCHLPHCGDGNANSGEECDDGALAATSACVPGCRNATCGDGYVQAGVEECDEGQRNGKDLECPANTTCKRCDGTCHLADGFFCGDSNISSLEGCDNGTGNGTAAKPGNGISTCGYVVAGGSCTTCTADCQTAGSATAPKCGDGTIDGPDVYSFGGEKCDLGSGMNTGTCTPASPEIACVACSSDCQTITLVQPTPGCHSNGILGPGEECDPMTGGTFPASEDGTCHGHDATKYVVGSGSISCASNCTIDTSSCNTCGNGSLDPGEECDNSVTGSSSGKFASGDALCGNFDADAFAADAMELACTAACRIDTSGCTPKPTCQDGTLQVFEQCEGSMFHTADTCVAMGYAGGTVPTCNTNCSLDTSGCYSCADGTLNGHETDQDCGGTDCVGCALNKNCTTTSDCLSPNVCDGGTSKCIAPPPSCADGIQNQSETDADCGGPTTCARCGATKSCTDGTDCISGVCDGTNKCTSASCGDGTVQTGETCDFGSGNNDGTHCSDGSVPAYGDVACTGCSSCTTLVAIHPPRCGDGSVDSGSGEVCDGTNLGGTTCASLVGTGATGTPLCHADCMGFDSSPCSATCSDGLQNQGESDTDCGGPCATKCATGKHCYTNVDCAAPSDTCGGGGTMGVCGM